MLNRRVHNASTSRAERIPARLEIPKLVERSAGRRQQHRLPRLRLRRRGLHRLFKRSALYDLDRRRRAATARTSAPPRRWYRPWRTCSKVARSRRQRVGLGLPADDPADRRISRQRGRRGVGIGRLAVVDEQHAVFLGDALHAVRQAGIGAQPLDRSRQGRARSTGRRSPRSPRSRHCAGPAARASRPARELRPSIHSAPC